eukprot:sb/3476171/
MCARSASMEIKEITSGEVVEEGPIKEGKVLGSNDKLMNAAKENMSPAEQAKVEEMLQVMQRDINTLHDGARFAKNKALSRIKDQTTGSPLEQVNHKNLPFTSNLEVCSVDCLLVYVNLS